MGAASTAGCLSGPLQATGYFERWIWVPWTAAQILPMRYSNYTNSDGQIDVCIGPIGALGEAV